jgi:hypothetical protein
MLLAEDCERTTTLNRMPEWIRPHGCLFRQDRRGLHPNNRAMIASSTMPRYRSIVGWAGDHDEDLDRRERLVFSRTLPAGFLHEVVGGNLLEGGALPSNQGEVQRTEEKDSATPRPEADCQKRQQRWYRRKVVVRTRGFRHGSLLGQTLWSSRQLATRGITFPPSRDSDRFQTRHWYCLSDSAILIAAS